MVRFSLLLQLLQALPLSWFLFSKTLLERVIAAGAQLGAPYQAAAHPSTPSNPLSEGSLPGVSLRGLPEGSDSRGGVSEPRPQNLCGAQLGVGGVAPSYEDTAGGGTAMEVLCCLDPSMGYALSP